MTEHPARVAIPEALADDVATRAWAYRPDVHSGDPVLVLSGSQVGREGLTTPPGMVGTDVRFEDGETVYVTAYAAVGSVDGGPRPEPGDRVLVLDHPDDPSQRPDGVRVVQRVTEAPSGLLVAVEADSPGFWPLIRRWALLAPAEPASPGSQGGSTDSVPGEAVSPNPLRNPAEEPGDILGVGQPDWVATRGGKPVLSVLGDYVCYDTGSCNCATGPNGEHGPHCGLEPLVHAAELAALGFRHGPDGENADVEPCDPSSPATHCGASDCTDHGCQEAGAASPGEGRASDASPADYGPPSCAAPPRPWRTGLSWGRTIIEQGTGTPDGDGRRADDRLVGVVETRQDAERIVIAVNATNAYDAPYRALAKSRAETKHLLGILTEVRAWLKAERDRYWAADSGTRDDFRSSVGDAFDRALDYLDERGAP